MGGLLEIGGNVGLALFTKKKIRFIILNFVDANQNIISKLRKKANTQKIK
jgi:hypothetical protein|tara:strand:+ start:150 stop:299 length:150 start_codon:yes stop_codon:yes gene_type:complete